MISKIQRKKFLLENQDFPQSNYRADKYSYPSTYSHYRITLDSKSPKGHAKLLSVELAKLVKLMGFKKLRFLGDTNIPWLFKDHDYEPVKAGLSYLKENKIGKTFNGALELNIVDLPEFLIHLFWLVRCNGVVNYIHFNDPEYNIIASFCKYGNVHFGTLNGEVDLIFNNVLNKTKFEILNGDCYEPFSKSGAIKGRRSTVL